MRHCISSVWATFIKDVSTPRRSIYNLFPSSRAKLHNVAAASLYTSTSLFVLPIAARIIGLSTPTLIRSFLYFWCVARPRKVPIASNCAFVDVSDVDGKAYEISILMHSLRTNAPKLSWLVLRLPSASIAWCLQCYMNVFELWSIERETMLVLN